ncbi:hypothetical protein BGZ65_006083 [Modicella reniformis]|uniref:Crinkler effector protein N-terminal domain-containing protein n=1 Tax=Modicella reniformis TaxID=1440133 RepID=A0A9P6SSV1_9FUNG|nr:hypothetical protein BGZ65_006083 [Modicella reniformis]
MANVLTIWCVVDGESTSRAFKVKLSPTDDVTDLKDRIKEKKPNDFAKVNAVKLTLWKVSLPLTEDEEEPSILLDNLTEKRNLTLGTRLSKCFAGRADTEEDERLSKRIKTAKYIKSVSELRPVHPEKFSHKFYDREILKETATWQTPQGAEHTLNGYQYNPQLYKNQSEGIRIGACIAVASGLVKANIDDLLFDHSVVELSIEKVMQQILHIRRQNNQRTLEAIIIHMDDYQAYINDAQDDGTRTWDQAREHFEKMQKQIGNYMRNCFIPRFLEMLSPKLLQFGSSKKMFLDQFDYSRQTEEDEDGKKRRSKTQALRHHQQQ